MRVLVATDGSDSSQMAIELVQSMRWPTGSELWLVTALERDEDVMSAAWVPGVALDLDERLGEMVVAAQQMLDAGAGMLAREGLRVETSVLRGRAGSTLVETFPPLSGSAIPARPRCLSRWRWAWRQVV